MNQNIEDEVDRPVDLRALKLAFALDAEKQMVHLKYLWSKHTTVFVFLRHFACIGCRAHAHQVWQDRKRYETGGARIVFIGNGSPHFIDKFREDLKLDDALILTDPTLECYLAAGFKKGFFNLVRPASLVNTAKLFEAGYRQTSYTKQMGTHWQLGGVLVMAKGDRILYRYISESLGDFPTEPQVVSLISEIEDAQT